MYSGAEDPREWVLARAIEEQAEQRGDQQAIAIVGGGSLTYRELSDQAAKVARQ